MARTSHNPSDSPASFHNADKEDSFEELQFDHIMGAAYKESNCKELMTNIVNTPPSSKLEGDRDALPEELDFDHIMGAAYKQSVSKKLMTDVEDEIPSCKVEGDRHALPEDLHFDHIMADAYKECCKLECELEDMRIRGDDLSAKQQEVEAARRAVQKAGMRFHEPSKACQLAEHQATMKGREAMKAQPGLYSERRSLQSIQEELAKLQKELQGHANAQHEASKAVVELERELEGMRTRELDLSAKQQEIEVARRAAQAANTIFHEAIEVCELAEHAMMKEHKALKAQREAMEAQRRQDNERRSLQAIQKEPAKLQMSKADAQSRYEHVCELLSNLDKRAVECEPERMVKQLQGHANAVQEAEALVAELERELGDMSILGVDMSAKQQEIVDARRAAQKAIKLFNEVLEACELIEANVKRREAMDAQRGLDKERRTPQLIGVLPPELQISKADAQSRYEHNLQILLRDAHNRAVNICEPERMRMGWHGQAKPVQEAQGSRAELQSKMEGMRIRGAELSAKQQEFEGAMRASGEAFKQHPQGSVKDHEAMESGLDDERRLQSIVEEPSKLQKSEADAQSRYERICQLLCDLHSRDVAEHTSKYGPTSSDEEDSVKLQKYKTDAHSRYKHVCEVLPTLDNRGINDFEPENLVKELQEDEEAAQEAAGLAANLQHEVENMRTSGADPSAKQQKIVDAKRAAQEAYNTFYQGLEAGELVIKTIVKELEAMEAQRGQDKERRSSQQSENLPAKLQMSKADAQSRAERTRQLLCDLQIRKLTEQMNKKRQGHANAAQEAEVSRAEEPPFDYSKAAANLEHNSKVLAAARSFFAVPMETEPGAAEPAETPVTTIGPFGMTYTYLPSQLEEAMKLSTDEWIADTARRCEEVRKFTEFNPKAGTLLAEYPASKGFGGPTAEACSDENA